ncbi:hypothetical protein Ciccas_013508 [Cichlidogyrus casuarinus]|uniref:Uncharacterized protein n=1 Tax=Cichlidogyrus casuarinus TaxID=1844966 RepID=A0ABD2PKD7_9PLAT
MGKLKTQLDPQYKQAYRVITNAFPDAIVPNLTVGLSKVVNEKFALIEEGPVLDYYKVIYCDTITSSGFLHGYYTFFTPKNSRFIRFINAGLSNFNSNKTLADFSGDLTPNCAAPSQFIQFLRGDSFHFSPYELTLLDVFGLFLIVAVGCAVVYILISLNFIYNLFVRVRRLIQFINFSIFTVLSGAQTKKGGIPLTGFV